MQMIPEDSVNVTAENVDTSNMFDNYINTQTSNADAIELTVDANKISHFASVSLGLQMRSRFSRATARNASRRSRTERMLFTSVAISEAR